MQYNDIILSHMEFNKVLIELLENLSWIFQALCFSKNINKLIVRKLTSYN